MEVKQVLLSRSIKGIPKNETLGQLPQRSNRWKHDCSLPPSAPTRDSGLERAIHVGWRRRSKRERQCDDRGGAHISVTQNQQVDTIHARLAAICPSPAAAACNFWIPNQVTPRRLPALSR